MLYIHKFVFNALEENTYVLYDDQRHAIIVDPGCYDKEEEEELRAFITTNELKPVMVLNTHCHIDHIVGNVFATRTFQCPLYIPSGEQVVLQSAPVTAPFFGFHKYEHRDADQLVSGELITLGHEQLAVLFVPGHSPGHCAFYYRPGKFVVSGDVLFLESVGRTDLPGGDYNTLMNSIHKQLFSLPDDTKVYPGHGPETSIGFEKRENPFCALRNSTH